MQKTKILFITEYLAPNLSAASEVVYRLADVLTAEYNCEISILGFDDSNEEVINRDSNNFDEYSIKSISDYNKLVSIYGKNRTILFYKFLKSPLCFIQYIRQRFRTINNAYIFEIKKLYKKNNYDCIVAFSSPRESIYAISKLNIKCPYVCYLLDPFIVNYININSIKYRKIEEKAFTKSSKIVVANKNYFDYEDKDLVDKLEILEFPNVFEQKTNINRIFDRNHIHLVYSGSLYSDIRNPKYTIELISKLKNINVIFHIVGCNKGKNGIPEELPKNVICHGRVSSKKAIEYMQSADILVNIGNTVENQIPSKLLTYISFGKPIINIMKSSNCPTLEYMNRYPLSYNILETFDLIEKEAKKLESFIYESNGKSIAFDQIEKIFYECTPSYVGKRLYDIVCEAIKNNKLKEEN